MDRLTENLIRSGVDPESIPPPAELLKNSQGISLKDADTLVTPDNRTMRLSGVNARETAKFMPGTKIEGAELGADRQTSLVNQEIESGRYNRPVYTGAKDTYNRELGDLENAQGQRLTNTLLNKGFIAPDKSVSSEQLQYLSFGRLDRAKRAAEGNETVGDQILKGLVKDMNPTGALFAKRYTNTARDFGIVTGDENESDYFIGPALRREGEDKKGYATGTASTAWDIGAGSLSKGLYDFLNMVGTKTGIESLTETADANINVKQSNLENLPLLKNPDAFDEKGNWKLDTVGKFVDYTVGAAAASSPQMLVSIASAFAAPFTYGLSLSIPAAIYSGQIWGNQKPEDKNATYAIGGGVLMSALDKLALGGLFPKGGSITSPVVQKAVKEKLIERGMTPQAAEEAFTKATIESTKEMAQAIKAVTDAQKRQLTTIGKEIAGGGASESITESAQEVIQYSAENQQVPQTPEEAIKFRNRIANAAVGGLVLGGAFGGGSAGARALMTKSENNTSGSTDLEFREDYKRRTGSNSVPTASDAIREAYIIKTDRPDLETIAEPETSKRSMEGIPSKIGSFINDKGLGSLFRTWSSTIMKGKEHVDEFTAALSTLLGHGKPLNGSSISEHQDLLEGNIQNNFGNKEELRNSFKGLSTEKISAILSSDKVVDYIDRLTQEKNLTSSASTKDVAGRLDIDNLLGDNILYKDAIIEYANKIDNLVNSYNAATGSNLKTREFLDNRPIDKTKVAQNSKVFISTLKSALNVDDKAAHEIYNTILNNENVNSIGDTIDEWLTPIDTLNTKNRDAIQLALNNPETRAKFVRFLSNNLLDNSYALAARGAAINTNKTLIGKDGAHLAALLDAANISDSDKAFMAKEIKDFIDMRNGNYNRIENKYFRGAMEISTFLSTLSSLPLAAISSTVEYAIIFRNLNKPQSVKAMKALLASHGNELGSVMADLSSTNYSHPDKNIRVALNRAGFKREHGIGKRNDVVAGYTQKWSEGFFKIIGLNSVTNITRATRLAIAADALNNWVNTVRNKDGIYSNEQVVMANNHLIRLGVDVDFMTSVEEHSEVNQARVNENLQRGSYNFVNEAVLVPNALNRPKFYSDPYLKLFTTFQGYTSTFTATVLPRLLGDLKYSGSDEQKNAASIIALTFALSLMALYVKDLIKYGESPPDWIKKDNDKQFQRIINQMGTLGTGQRVWDTISNISDNRYRSDTMYGTAALMVAGQSPQLSYINKILDLIEKPRIEKGARLLPIVGVSPAFAESFKEK